MKRIKIVLEVAVEIAMFVAMLVGFVIKLGLSKLKLCKPPDFRITG